MTRPRPQELNLFKQDAQSIILCEELSNLLQEDEFLHVVNPWKATVTICDSDWCD